MLNGKCEPLFPAGGAVSEVGHSESGAGDEDEV